MKKTSIIIIILLLAISAYLYIANDTHKKATQANLQTIMVLSDKVDRLEAVTGDYARWSVEMEVRISELEILSTEILDRREKAAELLEDD